MLLLHENKKKLYKTRYSNEQISKRPTTMIDNKLNSMLFVLLGALCLANGVSSLGTELHGLKAMALETEYATYDLIEKALRNDRNHGHHLNYEERKLRSSQSSSANILYIEYFLDDKCTQKREGGVYGAFMNLNVCNPSDDVSSKQSFHNGRIYMTFWKNTNCEGASFLTKPLPDSEPQFTQPIGTCYKGRDKLDNTKILYSKRIHIDKLPLEGKDVHVIGFHQMGQDCNTDQPLLGALFRPVSQCHDEGIKSWVTPSKTIKAVTYVTNKCEQVKSREEIVTDRCECVFEYENKCVLRMNIISKSNYMSMAKKFSPRVKLDNERLGDYQR
jgi:hypothetical protein